MIITTSAAQTNSALRVAAFELRDQYENLHKISFPNTNVIVMTVADRKGSEQIDDWIGPIKKRYWGRIEIEGVADMSTVPGALRSWVRGRFKKHCAYPVMLDWEGPVAHGFKYHENLANVFVIDRQGQVTAHFAGETNEVALSTLFVAVDHALVEPSR